jgi:hypothetical protein
MAVLIRSVREPLHAIRGAVGGMCVGGVATIWMRYLWRGTGAIAVTATVAGWVISILSEARWRGNEWRVEDN